MARSIEESPEAQRRGYIPPQNDKERFLMRHIEDLARTAESRGIPRYSSFLSDREQVLARAALAKAGCGCWRLEGGYPEAERRLAAIEPEGSWADSPLACVRLECRAAPGVQLPAHRDYLGSLMGLALKREALGDIVLPADRPGTAYVFALEPAARLICEELVQVGRAEVSCTRQPLEELPDLAPAEREKRTAAVSSLRLDAVLAAMLHCSRGAAAALIEAGRVEINHLPTESVHAPVYEGDIFTIRGRGRFALTGLPGRTKKDRQIIEFFQYSS
ncbi:MAG TPA: hypothetical protein H9890_06720 [Candidatus Faecalibacterium intestinigallinarum]|uniref:RNA-binding S4 domain-containing protein n=1 Tax=Candidatus Faecalibacterium intestinigallinarum TaxID=2838581 RepID=A0A9D1QAS7_9FIRM|nr:hypothetical protein [Candidatus Faecalibacterium intestinigallinarum]